MADDSWRKAWAVWACGDAPLNGRKTPHPCRGGQRVRAPQVGRVVVYGSAAFI